MDSFGSLRLPLSSAVATVFASIALGSVFLRERWFFPALFAVVITAAVTEGARRMSAPRSFVPLAGLLGLIVYLVFLYARDEAILGLVPTQDAFATLRDLFDSGRRDINRFAAPVGVSPGIELIATGGVGLVGLAVDTIAVTYRRAALAGLPLLALYTVPTTVAPDGVSWVAFALGGIGYLTLLLAEARERVSRWGRPMRYTAPRANWRPDVETAPLAQVGRRVGAAALGLALVVPAVLPEIQASSFGFGSGGFGRGGGGGNKVTVINPILDLGKDLRQGDDTELIRYSGPADYIRMLGLDVFTGDKWAPSKITVSNKKNDVTRGLGSPPGLGSQVATTNRRYSFRIFDLDETWLPLPYPTRRVRDIDGGWVYDPLTFNVFPLNRGTRQLRYKVTSRAVRPTTAQLRQAVPTSSLPKYVELPAGMPPIVAATASRVTQGLTTDFDKALALQNYLRGDDFTYSTEVADTVGDGNGLDAIAAFLRSGAGYCVHFASAMAVMARELGIPARVAVGFTPGDLAGDGSGDHIITAHDAHAWPELYFEGVGWTRFEPTKDGSRTQVPGYTKGAAAGLPGSTPNGSATGSAAPNPRASENAAGVPNQVQPLDSPTPSGGPRLALDTGRDIPVLPIIVVLLVLLAAMTPVLSRSFVRRARWRRATSPALLAEATWAELRDTLLDYGYAWPASDPPRRGAAHLVEERGLRGDAKVALLRLASAVERARYAPELGAVGDLRDDVETVRHALADGVSGWARMRARFLPRSARSVSSALSERFADALDALDALGARLRPRRGTS
jgi:transglutaminase-like putative cysteine protease